MATKHRILPKLSPEQIARFWSKVQKGSANECWPWMGYRNAAGYGRVGINGEIWQAQRTAYPLAHGRFPPELCVLHTCDNPSCVNPCHLRLGTHGDNARDRQHKDRGNQPTGDKNGSRTHPQCVPRGETHWKAKLTAEDVRQIRRRHAAGGITLRALGVKYNVRETSILRIVTRESWKHIE